MPKSSNKKVSVKKSIFANSWLIFFAILLVAGYYFYNQYKSSEVDEEGIIVCNKQGMCERSIHIHSDLEVAICSELQLLPKDTGELADIHTHKEAAKLHFHERLKTNSEGKVIDKTPLSLKNAVRAMYGLELSKTCIGDWCNGKKCTNGKVGKLNLTVNGQKMDDIDTYTWEDGDNMQLTFE